MPPKVEHHKSSLLLTAALFFVAVFIFGGWTEGPLTTGVKIGIDYVGFLGEATGGSFDPASTAGMIVSFVINLILYYIIATIIVFLYNLLFGR